MVDGLFKFSISMALLVMTLSIAAAAITKSNRAADFRPIWAGVMWTIKWVKEADKAASEVEANPKPFTEELKGAADKLTKNAEQGLQKMSTPTEFVSDPRLAACPPGSVDPTAGEVPQLLATQIKQNPTSYPGLTDSFIGLQSVLGKPNCSSQSGNKKNPTRHWRFAVAGGGFIDARATERSKVKLEFNF